MSWLDDIQTTLTIVTGDGKQYEPNWLNAKLVAGYNIAEFNFPNTKGTFVDKREPLGRKFSLELFFQGDNHLAEMKDFLFSAEDKRPWLIVHPFYEVLNVQPSGISVDNSDYNISKLTLTATETLEKVNPATIVIPIDKIDEDVTITNDLIANELEDADANLLLELVNDYAIFTQSKIENDSDGQRFINLVNKAREKIAGISTDIPGAIKSIQDVMLAPVLFRQDVNTKLRMINNSFDTLVSQLVGTVSNIKNLPNDFKASFEAFGSSIIGTLCSIVSNPQDTDYSNRTDINNTVENVLSTYGRYIESLDQMEIGTGGNPQDFQPNARVITNLNNIVSFTVSNLFVIAKDAKQERKVILTDDSDYITLAHRFYGLKRDDSTIDELISNNNLGLNGILNIKKGTEITYFI